MDYQAAAAGSNIPSLNKMEYDDFANLHKDTKTHWEKQKQKNKDKLDAILNSGDAKLVHDHSVLRKPTDGAPELYEHRTIEVCIITDPNFYEEVKERFELKTDKEINKKIFESVQKVLLSAETFLKHSSISNTGKGFRLQLNGIRVLKEWGDFEKMKKREKLQEVMFDLGDYMQVFE